LISIEEESEASTAGSPKSATNPRLPANGNAKDEAASVFHAKP
jgi:hypothetical protein